MESAFDPKRLAEQRKSQKLTQRGLAVKAGVSQALVAELERGKHPPSKGSLAKIAGALGVTESEFFSAAS
jgi:transcriptional regulator with XRE-family HTH domain